jgi:ssDNA-binding Zn-finger/Zn-ribbon topoisomerase 1
MSLERRLARLETEVGGCPRCHGRFIPYLTNDEPEPRGCPACGRPPVLVRRIVRDGSAHNGE